MEGFIGEIRLFGGNFAPRTWAFCQGQLMAIAQNTALFSILGTTYGGDGRTTFALPDLRGRVPLGAGRGPGLPLFNLGEKGGTESRTMTTSIMPNHNHVARAVSAPGNKQSPVGNTWASEAVGSTFVYSDKGVNTTMSPQALATAGGNQPFTLMQPFLGLYYIICLQGIFPSRN